jgi:WD40 repeat protein
MPWSLTVKGVSAAVFSGDGRTIVTVENEERDEAPGDNGLDAVTRVRSRDVETGQITRSAEFGRFTPFSRHRNEFLDLERHLLVGIEGEDKLSVWNYEKGTVLWTKSKVNSWQKYTLALDGTKIAIVTPSGDIEVFETESGKRLQHIAHPTDQPYFAPPPFSANGERLLFVSQKPKIIDIGTGTLIAETERPKIPLAVSRDGKTMACVAGDRIGLFDTRTEKEIRRLEHTTPYQVSVAFSDDGRFLVTGEDFAVGLWDTATGKRLNPLPGHAMDLRSVAFSPDGTRVASGGDGGLCILWELDGGKILHRFPGHFPMANSLAFSSDGRVLAVGEGSRGLGNEMAEVRLWNTDSGEALRSIPAHLCGIESIAFSHDDKTLYTAGSDVRVRIWDLATGNRLDQIRFVTEFALRPHDHSLVVIGRNWRPSLKTTIDSWKGGILSGIGSLDRPEEEFCDGMRFAQSGKLAISLCEDRENKRRRFFTEWRTFRSWDTATGKQVRSLPLPPIDRYHLHTWTVSHDGELAVIADGRHDENVAHVTLYDLVSGSALVRMLGHSGRVQAMAFSPDDKLLSTASHDTTALIWDLRAARILGMWPRLGEDERAVIAMSGNREQAIPFLIDRVRKATELDLAYARLIADLGSDDAAVVERASQRLEADGNAEFVLRLAVLKHPKTAIRERAEKTLSTLTAKRPEEAARLVAKLKTGSFITYEDVAMLGPAARATYKSARQHFIDREEFTQAETGPFIDAQYLAAELPPVSVLRAIRWLADAATPEATRFLQEVARGPDGSSLVQEARRALAARKN